MTRTSGRIVISSNLKHQLELAKAIFSKHISEGSSSPLLSLQGVDIGASAAKIDTAMEQH